MASLDNLTAAIAELDADVTEAAAEVMAALDALKTQISELEAGAVSQADIDALTATVERADAAVDALDEAVPEIEPPIEEPPVEEPPVEEPPVEEPS